MKNEIILLNYTENSQFRILNETYTDSTNLLLESIHNNRSSNTHVQRINEFLFDLLFQSVNLRSNLQKGAKNQAILDHGQGITKGEKVVPGRKSIYESAEACFMTRSTRHNRSLNWFIRNSSAARTTHVELKRPIEELESRFRVEFEFAVRFTTASWPRHFDPTTGAITPTGSGNWVTASPTIWDTLRGGETGYLNISSLDTVEKKCVTSLWKKEGHQRR